jgi:hypothetical protein
MTVKHFITILSLFLFSNFTFGQNTSGTKPNSDRREMVKSVNTSAYNKFKSSYALTRDTLNAYPDSLIIEGKLIDYTMGVSCGIFCGCGTFKIKLTKQCDNYKQTFIYVGVPCLNVLPEGLKKKNNWTLYKLPMNDKSCYWTEVPMNKFDTKGLPFYTLTKYNKTN